MTLCTVALAVVAVTLLSGHVAPSVDDNNRYLKVTPLRGGFRLAYTVFFGEIPGASERRQLDGNRDGRIDKTEARAYGDRLATQVRDAMIVEVDGAVQRVAWDIVDVGLGNEAVAAGSFSVDMIAYVCGGSRLLLRDQFRIPRPGETEVKVEDSPGVTVSRARVGAADDPRHDYRFVGPGGPLSEDGLEVVWSASPDAPPVPGNRCAMKAAETSGFAWWWIGIAAVIVVVAGVAALMWRRTRAS